MVLLVGVRAWTGGYIVRAEGVGWGWLGERRGGEGKGEEGEGEENNVVVVTVWDEQVIATVVLRVVQRRAWVRAWTTKLKYRGAGVGRAVLEEAVRVAVGEYGCVRVEFAEDHASECVLILLVFLFFF